MTADTGVRVVKEMGITHREFVRTFARLFPGAAAKWHFSGEGKALRFGWGEGTIEVHLGPESERRIAMMALPHTSVTLTFEALTADERQEFLAAFDRRFQRGGG